MDKRKRRHGKSCFCLSIGLFIVVAKSVELATDSSIEIMIFNV